MKLLFYLSNIILLIAPVFTFSYDENVREKKSFFFLCFKYSSVLLQSHLRDTLFTSLLRKVHNSTFLTQICPKKDIGLEFLKTNLRIRINILEILCQGTIQKESRSISRTLLLVTFDENCSFFPKLFLL